MGLGMSALSRLVCVCLLCLCVAACGGSSSAPNNRQQITNLLSGMYTALAHGDYASVCGYLSARQQNTVIANARRDGVNASSCTGVLTTVLKEAGITRAQLAQTFGVASSPKIDSVSVNGSQATVTFTEKINGQTYTETDGLVREGGQWKADRIIKRSQVS